MIGKFRDYTVYIGTGEDEVILSSSPVVINYTGDVDDPLKPIRSSECLINLITDSFPTHLFTNKTRDTEVKIYKGDDLLWLGHLEPNVYSQPLDDGLVELEIVALDYLSTMEQLSYTSDGGIKSFKELIIQCTGLELETAEEINYHCLESNFTDEDGDNMTNYEVVENILLFLGLCCYLKADKVVVYDPVKASGLVYDSDIITKTPGTLSIGDVYNKVVINSSVYNDDNYFKNFSDAQYLNAIKNVPVVSVLQSTKYISYKYLRLSSSLCEFKSYDANGNEINYITGLRARTAFAIKTKWWKYKEEQEGSKQWTYWVCMPYHVAQSVPMVIYKINEFSPPYYKGYLSLNFDVLADVDLPEPAAVDGFFTNANIDDEKIDYKNSNNRYNPEVTMLLKIGDYYWTGSSWSTLPVSFIIKIGEEGDNPWRTIHNPRSEDFYVNGSEFKGYKITLPDDKVICGPLELKINRPNFGNYSECKFVYMKNFELSYVIDEVDNGIYYNEEERYKQQEDIVWESNTKNGDEFQEIELKLCTNVFNTTSKASVLTKDSNGYQLLNTIDGYYQEEHLVDKYYNLLCDPKILIESEVLNHDLIYPNDRIDNYQVIENSWDLDNDKQTIKLRQL